MVLRILHCLSVAVLVLATPAVAQTNAPAPPEGPILRIDPGMHAADINRVGADAGCTLLATGSVDKTVRLWRLPEGKLLRVLRLPIGPGYGGRVHALAIAPDASWIAAGGWDAAFPSMRANFVYIFDPATGTISARLGPLENSIVHLAASPDGRYLAATLHSGGGVRVWEKTGANWKLVMEDKNYGNKDSMGAAFDRAGVLYTIADDGKLRRYSPGYKSSPTWVKDRENTPPSSVAVISDRVAVGYEQVRSVQVYDAATLKWRFTADTSAANNGDLGSVAWSADGSRLYASGYFQNRSSTLHTNPILVWDQNGQGRPREIAGPVGTVFHIVPCGEGVAFGAARAFGVLTRDGHRQTWQTTIHADLRRFEGSSPIAVSADGSRVRFALEPLGRTPGLFNLATEQLRDAPSELAELTAADTGGLPTRDWDTKTNPTVGAVSLSLDPFEKSQSLAVAPDKQRFVLGADFWLRGYTKEGKLLWRKEAWGTVWSVNITRNGKLVVAGYADGTVRWHRLSDGQELLALFVHKADRRWVAWTPSGYYVASPGAESLIGWHVNGKTWDETPQFYPVSHFRDRFNRPDIVKLVLATLAEDSAIAQANKRDASKSAPSSPKEAAQSAIENVIKTVPPTIIVQKPGDGDTFRTPEVTIEYDIFSPNGRKIVKIDYLVNNAALGARFAAPIGTGKFISGKVTLSLPPEDVTITLVARDEDGGASEPSSRSLRWDGAKAGQVAMPRLRALFVGVNAYTSPKVAKLEYAAKDATALAAFFKAHEGKSYSKVEATVLPNVKRTDVIKGLEWLHKGSEESDVNLLFLAGHGATIDQDFYYLAADGDPDDVRATGVSKDDILRAIRSRKGAMVVMIDACYSGSSASLGSVDMNMLANQLGDQKLGVQFYASSSARQVSFERPEWGHGAFTRALLDGLGGAADSSKLGYIDTEELSLYIRRRVMNLTKDQQVPVRVKPDAAPEMKIVVLK